MKLPSALTLALPLLVFGCSKTQEDAYAKETEPTLPVTEKLEPFVYGDVPNMHTLGGVFLAGQPGAADFELAAQDGIKTVIDLRMADEGRDCDEPAVVNGHGMDYVHLGFKAPETLTDELFDEARGILVDEAKRPVLMHCGSANRVGAVWLAHRVLDGGLDWDTALTEAQTVGLKTAAYEARAKAYVDARAGN